MIAIGLWVMEHIPDFGLLVTIVAIFLAIGVYRLILKVFGFAIQVGHIAVITQSIKTGQVPPNQLSYGKNKVVARFATVAVFFALNRQVDRAIKQLQRSFGNIAGELVGGGLGMGKLISYRPENDWGSS